MHTRTSTTSAIVGSKSSAAALCCPGAVNVGESERLISLLGGGLLLAYGLSSGSTTGLGIGLIGAGLAYRGWTGHCHAYQALGISSAEHNDQTSIPSGQGTKIEYDITIQKPADELFRFWRKLDNLPRVMRHLNSVVDLGDGRSKWNAKGPTGDVQWESEIISERPGEMIGWRSLEGSTIQTAGSVHFRRAPGDRGTEVKVVLTYNPPGGQVGHALAWLAGSDPSAEIREDLQMFKHTMETATPMLPNPVGSAQAKKTQVPTAGESHPAHGA